MTPNQADQTVQIVPSAASEVAQLQDELIQLDIETFEIEDLPDLEQHAAKSCTSTSSTSSTSSCSALF